MHRPESIPKKKTHMHVTRKTTSHEREPRAWDGCNQPVADVLGQRTCLWSHIVFPRTYTHILHVCVCGVHSMHAKHVCTALFVSRLEYVICMLICFGCARAALALRDEVLERKVEMRQSIDGHRGPAHNIEWSFFLGWGGWQKSTRVAQNSHHTEDTSSTTWWE